MKKFHNLNGQNLLRHQIIEDHFRNFGYDFVVSDSAKIRQLIEIIFFTSYKVAFHFLELYTFSFTALSSELKFRISSCGLRPLSLTKLLVNFSLLFFKALLLRKILKKDSIIIISSDLRRQFLKRAGFKNPIFVLRNKPVYSAADIIAIGTCNSARAKRAVLIGNLNNRTQFRNLCGNLANIDITVYCYGVSKSDREWVARESFDNVVVLSSIPTDDVPHILKSSMFGVCLYSETSLNQKYSASSKIFEILFWGAIPIIGPNQGLLSELNQIGAHYFQIQDLILGQLSSNSLEHHLYQSRACLFSSELDNLNIGELPSNL